MRTDWKYADPANRVPFLARTRDRDGCRIDQESPEYTRVSRYLGNACISITVWPPIGQDGDNEALCDARCDAAADQINAIVAVWEAHLSAVDVVHGFGSGVAK